MKKKFIAVSLLAVSATHAQTKIKDGTVAATSTTPNANAVLDVESSNKGLLMPRVALTSTTSASPLSAFVAGMKVYNTATAGVDPNGVVPGEYYCDGNQWVRLGASTSTSWNGASSITTGPALGVWAQNTTGKPLIIYYHWYGTGPYQSGIDLFLNNSATNVGRSKVSGTYPLYTYGSGTYFSGWGIIPSGSYYKFDLFIGCDNRSGSSEVYTAW